MIEVDFGDFSDPWRGTKPMTEAPWIHETALIKDSRMGAWTVAGPRCEVLSSDLLDYSYLVKDVEVFSAEVGKFANVASHVRINPTNHQCGGLHFIILVIVLRLILWLMTMMMKFRIGESNHE
jgi:hypothetical protein